MTAVAPPPLSLPDARLGELLRRARENAGRSLREVAIRSGLPARTLRRFEDGRTSFTGEELLAVSRAYGVRLAELVAARVGIEVDLSAGTISAGARTVPLEGSEADKVLHRYLTLVRELRGLPDGSSFTLRRDDVAVLADVLGIHEDDVAHRLGLLMGRSDEEAVRVWRILREWRVLGPTTAGVVALSACGTMAAVEPPPPPVDIGTAIQLQRLPDGTIVERELPSSPVVIHAPTAAELQRAEGDGTGEDRGIERELG